MKERNEGKILPFQLDKIIVTYVNLKFERNCL